MKKSIVLLLSIFAAGCVGAPSSGVDRTEPTVTVFFPRAVRLDSGQNRETNGSAPLGCVVDRQPITANFSVRDDGGIRRIEVLGLGARFDVSAGDGPGITRNGPTIDGPYEKLAFDFEDLSSGDAQLSYIFSIDITARGPGTPVLAGARVWDRAGNIGGLRAISLLPPGQENLCRNERQRVRRAR